MMKFRRTGCLIYLITLALFWAAVIMATCAVLGFLGITSHAAATDGEIMLVIKTEKDEPKVEIGIAPGEDAPAMQAHGEPEGFIILPECPLPREKQAKLYEAWTGACYDYPTALGLIDAETNGTFAENAVNHDTDDYGLFQLNRRSWLGKFRRMYGIRTMDEMLDFDLNLKGGLYVYGNCVERYGQTEKALVAYNMGSAYYASTEYSRKVLAKTDKWRELLKEVSP